MNCNFESEGKKMKSTLIRLGLMAVMISALASCGGASDGAPGAPGAPGTNGTSGNVVSATSLTTDQWLALKPTIDPASISVTINSPPVVKFTVTDQYGNPMVGLGGQVQGTANSLPKNYNIVFTLAKLVPVVGGPSKWVSYLVTKPSVSGGVVSWAGTYPTFDQEGTLIDNGDGSYQYTFYRDIKQAATIVAGLTDSGSKLKADLGDVSYDPTLTTRLGIVIQGNQPGTGTNTPNGVQVTTPVPIVNTFNIGYDFRPDGGTITTTRDIVEKASCTECHQGRGIGHFSPNYTTSTDPARGTPAGVFIGRNDPRLCVTCHTDQAKYSFAETPKVVSATGVANYDDTSSIGYKKVYGEAAFTYPRMIHQTHMGNQLVKTGYNLNAHAKKSDGTTGCDSTSSNAGQCFNQVEYPQDVRNCTKCHEGSPNDPVLLADSGYQTVARPSGPNQTADGNNWLKVPSRLACGACHDGIDFTLATGAVGSVTLQDRDADVKAKVAVGTTHSGHGGGVQLNDSLCTTCHSPGNIAIYHSPAPTNPATGIPASADINQRTMSATITAANIDAASGVVSVSFTLADSAGGSVDYAPGGVPTTGVVPVTAGTDPIPGVPFRKMNFTLAKLLPAVNGASTYWKNYTGRCINNANIVPPTTILQGYSEIQYGQAATSTKPLMDPGILTSLGGGKWTYKFRLVNAGTHYPDGSGDIRTITTAIRTDVTGGVTCADPNAGYDPTLTHRIGMIFNKTSDGNDNTTNATYDFVPDGVT
jgi:OmcA/MtrC family decaheme c-type cytochrome